MDTKVLSILPLLVLVPLLGTLFISLADRAHARAISIVIGVLTFFMSFVSFVRADSDPNAFVQYTDLAWLPDLGVHFRFGADGLVEWLVVLTSLLGLGALVCPTVIPDEKRKVYYGCILALVGLLNGAFSALDLVLFYLFFEACLLPVYFLIGIFGGPRRRISAQKFLIYSVVGALCMLASIIGVYSMAGTFDMAELREKGLTGEMATLLFAGFAISFAIKTPMFPLHTWQADAYSDTPTPVVAVVGGAMAKLGTYGFFRICLGIFPVASAKYGFLICMVAAIGIVYAALIAAVQRDLKRVMAFSSVSHLGFIVLGLFSGTAQGSVGACAQMINHGIIAGGLFFLLAFLEKRRGTLQIRLLGGLWDQMPVFSRIFLLFTLASVALPLTNGFVGEFLTLLGAYSTYPAAAAIATTGVIWSAVYMLGMYQKVFYGVATRPENQALSDIADGEGGLVAPLVVLIFLLGIYPQPLLVTMESAVTLNTAVTPNIMEKTK
ncbi:MAG: NADH-quinone oxidoreductase subunit M [Armatimonas sp.]